MKDNNTTNEAEAWNIAALRYLIDELGMSEDAAIIKRDLIADDIALMETPDRYAIAEMPELYDVMVTMLDFATAIQEYTLRLLDDKRFKRKTKGYKYGLVKKVVEEMRSRNSRFPRKRWLAYTGDVWLRDTIQYAITNRALLRVGHINEAELVKRTRAAIFKRRKGSPLKIDYKASTITLPNIDGVKGITLSFNGLEKRSKLRNIRIVGGDADRMIVCIHHLDHNEKENIKKQRLIAKRCGVDVDAIDKRIKEATMKPKNNLVDLFN